MNKTSMKILIISIVCVLIAGAIAGYFARKSNNINDVLYLAQQKLSETRQELNMTQDVLNTTKANLHEETEKTMMLEDYIQSVNEELEVANETINDLKNEEYNLIYLGNYSITHYCTERYKHICGTGNGVTATGTTVTAGRTVAVDPSVIPYGSKIYIEGYGWRVAEDCGGAVDGRHIDMAVDTHANAIAMGNRNSGVWILVKNS